MKKILNYILVSAAFFLGISTANARMLTSEEVFNDYNTTFIEPMNSHGAGLTVTNDTTNKKYIISSGTDELLTFNYNNEYIEYDNRSAVITEDNIEQQVGVMFCYDAMVNTILRLSGYDDKTIKSEEFPYLEDTFEPYGYQVTYEHHDFSGEDENGPWSMSGEYVKYFKMSFDTDKIDALMNRYGIDKEEYYEYKNQNNRDDFYQWLIENMNVKIEFDEVTTNSVTLVFTMGSYYSEDKVDVLCDIYRSTSENGTYEKITSSPVSCVNNSEYKDTGLNPNTKYYYKTKYADNNRYSNVFGITTLPLTTGTTGTTGANTNKNGTVKNPETGVFTYTVASLAVILGSVGALLYTRKKNAFKKL